MHDTNYEEKDDVPTELLKYPGKKQNSSSDGIQFVHQWQWLTGKEFLGVRDRLARGHG